MHVKFQKNWVGIFVITLLVIMWINGWMANVLACYNGDEATPSCDIMAIL